MNLTFPNQKRTLVVTQDNNIKPTIHNLLKNHMDSVSHIFYYSDIIKEKRETSKNVVLTDDKDFFISQITLAVPVIIKLGGSVWIVIDSNNIQEFISKLNGIFELILLTEKPFLNFTVFTSNPKFNNIHMFDQYILDTQIEYILVDHLIPNKILSNVYKDADRRLLGWIRELDSVYFLIDQSEKNEEIENYHIVL